MAKRSTEVDFELSRPLTFSEREQVRSDVAASDNIQGHRFNKGGDRVTLFSRLESRELAQELHDYLAVGLFNVHILSAHTIYPRVKV